MFGHPVPADLLPSGVADQVCQCCHLHSPAKKTVFFPILIVCLLAPVRVPDGRTQQRAHGSAHTEHNTALTSKRFHTASCVPVHARRDSILVYTLRDSILVYTRIYSILVYTRIYSVLEYTLYYNILYPSLY